MRVGLVSALIACLGLAMALGAVAPLRAMADEVKTERVSFPPGASEATIKGSIKGRMAMHYLAGAKAGQNMRVDLKTDNDATYFNIFAPGDTPGGSEAMFIGSNEGNSFAGSLPESGDYLIQVYLYRNAARRNETANFTFDVAIGAEQDAKVPGTEFNATGKLGCARDAGQPLAQCEFGTIRNADGTAVLTIFWPDAGSRVIYFQNGNPVRYDESQADAGAVMKVMKNADLFTITVGRQRFEFPEATINGG